MFERLLSKCVTCYSTADWNLKNVNCFAFQWTYSFKKFVTSKLGLKKFNEISFSKKLKISLD